MATYIGNGLWFDVTAPGSTSTITCWVEYLTDKIKPLMTKEQINRFAWLRAK